MSFNNVLRSAIYGAIDQVNEQLPPEKKLIKSADTALIGESSGIDSLTLISFVVALEQSIEAEYGHLISLTDDDSILTDINGPLGNLSALAEYLTEQMQIETNAR